MNLKNTYFGFTDNLKPMQKAKVEKTLNNLIRYNNKIYTEKEFVYIKLLEGATPEAVEDYQYYSRKTGELTKPKTDYRLNFISSYGAAFNTFNKTLYEYSCYLLQNNFLNEQKANEYITVEQARIEVEKQTEADRQAKEKAEREHKEQEQEDFENWLTEQARQYNNTEKIELLRKTFISEVGSFNNNSIKLLVLIDNFDDPQCKNELKEWLAYFNTASLKTFFYITGINLGHTDKTIQTKLNEITSKDFQGMLKYKKQQEKVKNETNDTFYILITIPEPHFEAVTGEYISKYGLDLFIRESGNTYYLSECRTGLLVTSATTKKELFEKLEKNIDQLGTEKFQTMIEDAIKKYGISPKYNAA